MGPGSTEARARSRTLIRSGPAPDGRPDGPTPRYERESEDGETLNIDIGARVVELMDRIAETLTVVDDGTDEMGTVLAM